MSALSGVSSMNGTLESRGDPIMDLFLEDHVMKKATLTRAVLLVSLVLVASAAAQQTARSSRFGRGGPYGDWQVKVQFGEREMDAILSFSRNSEGNLTAQWISFWGATELKDVAFEEGKLSFVLVVRFGDNDFTSNFTGAIEDGQLTGVLSSDRGESKVKGVRSPRIARAVGNWQMKFKVGEREITTTLVVRNDKEGNLTGEWESPWGEHVITDIAYERGNLAYKRTSKFQDREFASTFEGAIEGDTLSGTIKSEMGEITVQGARIGADLIGTWNLDVDSERGMRRQRLRVNADMTGLYGTVPIKKVNLEEGSVDFMMVMEYGDQSFEMTFRGKLEDAKLTGEMTTSRGTRKITGTKVIRPTRGRPRTR